MKLLATSAIVLIIAVVFYFYLQANPLVVTSLLINVRNKIDQHLAKQKLILRAEDEQFEQHHDAYIQSNDLAQLLLHMRGLTARELIAVIHRTKKYDDHFPLEDLLSSLEHGTETIASDVLPLTLEQAKAICRCHKVENCLEETPILLDLAKEVDAILKEKYKGEAFVKISSASGKDAIDENNENFYHYWNEYLNSTDYQVAKQRNVTWEMNYRICALTNVHQKILKMTSGMQTIQMLINSQKVIAHLATAIIFPASFRKSIIIREWIDMPVEKEFRGWVVNNKLQAVSQFSYFCYNEELVKHHAKIERAIEEFFNTTVRPKFDKIPGGHPSRYMIDFFVPDFGTLDDDDDSSKARQTSRKPHIMVLEIGGISVYTGLFNRDDPLFDGYKDRFELRILRQMNIAKELDLNIPEWIPFITDGIDEKLIEQAKQVDSQQQSQDE